MKIWGFFVATGFLLFTQLTLHAAVSSDASSVQDFTSKAEQAAPNFESEQTFVVEKEFTITPIGYEREEGSIANSSHTPLTFYKTDSFILMDKINAPNGDVMLRIGTEYDEAPDFYAWAKEMPANAIRLYNESDDPETASLNDDEDAMDHTTLNYFETEEARHGHGGHARHNHRGGGSYCTRHPYSKGCCYSGVKNKLLALHLVKYRLGGQAARTATAHLGAGWHSVGCGARSNPIHGTTCSYAGGKWGHVELFNAHCGGWWYGGRGSCGAHMNSPKRRCISCKAPSR